MKTNALVILDGFGLCAAGKGNAITLAHKPNIDGLVNRYAHSTLEASGLAVGLPAGQMGNSEVGHLNIGAGRVVYQDITAIDKSIADKDFFSNPALLGAIDAARATGGYLHLIGLCSNGGVHSHLDHLNAILELCRREKFDRVYVHAITDGRDTDPQSAMDFIKKINGKIATVSGRYYAMDRDNRWERIAAAYDCIVSARGGVLGSCDAVVAQSYANGITDEFIVPTVVGDYAGAQDGDAIVCFNFRSDRARQMAAALSHENFAFFNRKRVPKWANFVIFTQYFDTFDTKFVAFPPRKITNTLGETLGKHGLSQVRIAETEKYAHLTFFFNGGVEEPNRGETRILVQSPKVATYDMEPAMSANELCARAIAEIGKHDVMIINFANCDMVGHTGVIDAAVRAVETVDACVGKLVDAILANGGAAIVTADHGNAEQMLSSANTPFTAHTTNPVPFIIAGAGFEGGKVKLRPGRLCDVAPTLLGIIGIEKPTEMTGNALF